MVVGSSLALVGGMRQLSIFNCLIASLAASAAACGGDDSGSEFEGTYQVTSHVMGDCQVQDTDVPGDFDGNDFFRLELDSFFGAEFLGYRSCTTASECDEDSNLFNSFFKNGDVFETQVSFATGDEPNCNVTASRGPISFNAAGDLEVVITTKSGIIMADDCLDALDLVEENFDTMTCDTIERMVATPL